MDLTEIRESCCCHITHRCQERRYLLRYARDRRAFVKRLWQMKQGHRVDVLSYMATSNHFHLLLWAERPGHASEAMQFLGGVVAQDYNRRKKREGAFWRGRHRATLVQTGPHLCRCLFYIDMNMVRAGMGRDFLSRVGRRPPAVPHREPRSTLLGPGVRR